MNILEQLKAMIPVETIGGVDVEKCGEFTPVLPYRMSNDPQDGRLPECPVPCRVQQEGSRWCVWLPPNDPERYRWVKEEQLKVMRARYILLKNWFFTNIEGCNHRSRDVIISRFFPGGLFKPDAMKNEKPAQVMVEQ